MNTNKSTYPSLLYTIPKETYIQNDNTDTLLDFIDKEHGAQTMQIQSYHSVGLGFIAKPTKSLPYSAAGRNTCITIM